MPVITIYEDLHVVAAGELLAPLLVPVQQVAARVQLPWYAVRLVNGDRLVVTRTDEAN